MSAIFVTIIAAVILLLLFLGFFIWAIRSGQYEDLDTPAKRILMEDWDEPKRS